jgi:hypothetical protein
MFFLWYLGASNRILGFVIQEINLDENLLYFKWHIKPTSILQIENGLSEQPPGAKSPEIHDSKRNRFLRVNKFVAKA